MVNQSTSPGYSGRNEDFPVVLKPPENEYSVPLPQLIEVSESSGEST